MTDATFPSIKKAGNDKKYRMYEAIQAIQDAILKRKFNQACDHAAKYYLQNKTSLSNEETYQLCWLSCQSMTKKMNLRLTASPKSYIPLTQSHLQHLFSLYLSLHILIFPEVINKDRQHFDFLSTSQQLINPRAISPHDLVFQRKHGLLFLQKDQIDKCLKNLVKQHLRITNNVLMFNVKNKRSAQTVIEAANKAEQIFNSFKQHEFPVQIMNFQLIKLSIMEDLRIKQGFRCEYRLPIGLINKIYTHLRNNKDNALQHYIKKLCSYLVLSFRNLSLSIQDIYIVCQQVLYMTKLIQQKAMTPSSFHTTQFKKMLPFLKLNRQLTIQGDHIQQNMMGRSIKRSTTGSFSTSNKISQKRLQSKTKLQKPESHLKSIALLALEKISNHLDGRKQAKHIILSYFTKFQLEKFKGNISDQIIQNQVLLQISRKNRKGRIAESSFEEISQKSQRKKHKGLTSLLNKKGLQKKILSFQEEQKETLNANTSKKQGKFILKNIHSTKKEPQTNSNIDRRLQQIVNNDLMSKIEMIDESSSDQQGNVKLDFERQRRRQMKLVNDKHSIKMGQKLKVEKAQNAIKQMVELQSYLQINDQERVRSISLLNDVVKSQINQILQLSKQQSEEGKRRQSMLNTTTFKKLQNLKFQVDSLNIQRKLLVERLTKRKQTYSLSYLDSSFNFDKRIQYKQQKQSISNFAQNLKQKSSKNIAVSSKSMNSQKQNNFKVSLKPKIKLKIDKGGKKMPQITFASLQQAHKKLQNPVQCKKQNWDMVLSSQYDKLRRDVSKNQFASQNQKKSINKNNKCKTIRQIINDYE